MRWITRYLMPVLFNVLLVLPAAAVTITFDEFSPTNPQPTLTASTGGVTISYDGLGSGLAAIGDLGPEVGNNLLLGDSIGLLTLDFAMPVLSFGFDFALDAFGDVASGVFVELYFLNSFLADFSAAAVYDDAIGMALGQFNYAGPQFTQALLLFDTSDSGVFTFDNLTARPVPEPATFFLVAGGLLGAGLLKRKRMFA